MASAKRASRQGEHLVLEEFLPYRLSILSNRISRAIAARYAKAFKLTIPEWRVIAVLGRTPGLTATEVAEATEMDKVAVSRAVSRLAAARRLETEVDAHDARRQVLRLSHHGEMLHARIAPIALEIEQTLLATLSQQDRARLDLLISQLSKAAKRL